ncbi:hypothetical protein ANN_17297 [Periplaneta americana]|uniref:DDE Tnp4 domain-containing protein n=1 Tax=Periplaneta americana TaxID=6978 RepID=A0ABQ8STY8_PERAM|nr:hypothetical protein ANN_17297 [Periplaneta americana]
MSPGSSTESYPASQPKWQQMPLTGQCTLETQCASVLPLKQSVSNKTDNCDWQIAYYESVKNAAWASDWIGAPIFYQRNITFIIAQANHKFTLTAGKFFQLSNATLSNMLNESLSLFMFLLTMKDKNEEIIV